MQNFTTDKISASLIELLRLIRDSQRHGFDTTQLEHQVSLLRQAREFLKCGRESDALDAIHTALELFD